MLRYVHKTYKYPYCGRESKRHSTRNRTITTLKGIINIKLSVHYCLECRKHFSAKLPEIITKKKSRYGNDVINEAVRYDGTLQQVEIHLHQTYGIRVPQTTIHDWKHEAEILEEERRKNA